MSTFPPIRLALIRSLGIPQGSITLLKLSIMKTRNVSRIAWVKPQPALKNTPHEACASFLGSSHSLCEPGHSGQLWTAGRMSTLPRKHTFLDIGTCPPNSHHCFTVKHRVSCPSVLPLQKWPCLHILVKRLEICWSRAFQIPLSLEIVWESHQRAEYEPAFMAEPRTRSLNKFTGDGWACGWRTTVWAVRHGRASGLDFPLLFWVEMCVQKLLPILHHPVFRRVAEEVGWRQLLHLHSRGIEASKSIRTWLISLDSYTHVRDPKEALVSQLWNSSALVTVDIWRMNQ